MISATRGDFLTYRRWFEAVVGGKDLVLRHTSALECLDMFVGYLNEKKIDVYAMETGEFQSDLCPPGRREGAKGKEGHAYEKIWYSRDDEEEDGLRLQRLVYKGRDGN